MNTKIVRLDPPEVAGSADALRQGAAAAAANTGPGADTANVFCQGADTAYADVFCEAGGLLRVGGLVAFPTETVYGLGANIYDENAFRSVFRAKGRPADNPLIVHISNPAQLDGLCADIPADAAALARRFWPGPLTLVLKKRPTLANYITAGLDTVAVRLPSHPVALALLTAAGVPVAAPSANLSGKPSPTRGEHVIRDLAGKVDMIIDAGPVEVGLESTVLDMTRSPAVILRHGAITREDIAAVIGYDRVDPGAGSGADTDANIVASAACTSADAAVACTSADAPRSPGTKYRHYAPDAPMALLKGSRERIARRLELLIRGGSGVDGGAIAILASDETLALLGSAPPSGVAVDTLGSVAAPAVAAERLYGALRAFDDKKVGRIYCEYYDGGGISRALRDRMERAASGNIVDVDGMGIRSVLFVCTGNTCRSAMAGALFNAAAARAAALFTEPRPPRASSAGLSALDGDPANPLAVATLDREYGIDLSRHRARSLTPELLASADLTLTMTRRHKDAVLALSGAEPARVFTLAEFARQGLPARADPSAGSGSPLFYSSDADIQDPFGSGEQTYAECARTLYTLIGRLVRLLSRLTP